MKNYMNDNGSKFFRSVVLGNVFGIISMIVLTLIFSFVVASTSISDKSLSIFSMIIIGFSALICGFSAAKINKEKSLLVGTASGAILYFLIGIVAMIITKNAFSSTFVIRMLISIISAAMGSVLSSILGRNNKYI